jgi:hypothetical protein
MRWDGERLLLHQPVVHLREPSDGRRSIGYLFVQGVGTLKYPSITSCRETAGEAGAHVVRTLPGARNTSVHHAERRALL